MVIFWLVQDSSAVRRLFVRLAGAVGQKAVGHQRNLGLYFGMCWFQFFFFWYTAIHPQFVTRFWITAALFLFFMSNYKLHKNRIYFVIQLQTWFCLSYFLKANIKCYCIYQYFMSINSFFNTVSVSRYSRPITVTRDPL
jgi:hypothetical protein